LAVVDAARIAYEVSSEFVRRWHDGVIHSGEDIPNWEKLPPEARYEMTIEMGGLLEMDQPVCGSEMGQTVIAMVAKALKPHVGRLVEHPIH